MPRSDHKKPALAFALLAVAALVVIANALLSTRTAPAEHLVYSGPPAHLQVPRHASTPPADTEPTPDGGPVGQRTDQPQPQPTLPDHAAPQHALTDAVQAASAHAKHHPHDTSTPSGPTSRPAAPAPAPAPAPAVQPAVWQQPAARTTASARHHETRQHQPNRHRAHADHHRPSTRVASHRVGSQTRHGDHENVATVVARRVGSAITGLIQTFRHSDKHASGRSHVHGSPGHQDHARARSNEHGKGLVHERSHSHSHSHSHSQAHGHRNGHANGHGDGHGGQGHRHGHGYSHGHGNRR